MDSVNNVEHYEIAAVQSDSVRNRDAREIPFGKLRAGSRPAEENAGLRDDAPGNIQLAGIRAGEAGTAEGGCPHMNLSNYATV